MLISKEDIDEVKARHELSAFITDAGVKLKPVGKYLTGLCLFHDDHNASLVVDKKKQVWNCLGACSANGNAGGGKGSSGGDLFAFAMKLWGVDFREAFRRLGGVVRDEIPPPRPRHRLNGAGHGGPRPAGVDAAPTSRAPRAEVASRVVEHMVQELSQQRRAQEYLESRGLRTPALWRAFKLGYSSGSVANLAGTEQTSEVRRLLIELGILTEAGHERMKGRIVFPLVAFNQLPVGLYGRAIDESLEPHHLFLPGPRRGLFNWNAVRRSKELLIVESVIDALSLIEAGVGNAVPLYGINGLTDDHKDLVKRCLGNVVVALDADEAGRKATPQVVAAFEALGVKARAIEWPEKDPNELLVRHGPAKTREIAEKLLASPRPRDVAPARVPTAEKAPAGMAADAGDPPTVNGAANPLPLIADPAPDDRTPPAVKEEKQQEPQLEPGERATHEERPQPAQTPGLTREELLAEKSAAPAVESMSDTTHVQPAPDAGLPPALPETSAATLSEGELRSATLTVRYEDRRYGLTWLESPSVAQLRAHTRLELLPEAADEGALPLVTFLDSINLASGRSRDGFFRRVLGLVSPETEKLLPQKDALSRLIEADLMRLYELGERRMKALLVPKTSTNAMTDERRERALSYLLTPDLLSRLSTDLDAMGYVGERRAKLLGYLVSISRKLPEALSMVILSASGSGKSALAEVLERLTPEEDLLVVSRFTAASLYWMERDAMKRKFVSIEERGGSEEADYAIRALQSKKQLTMMAPIKDQASGKLETKFFFVEGPTAFLESTTESQINHENATRCFEERLDESREQTRRIHESQRFSKTPEGQRQKVRAEEIAALHRDVQRCLRVVKVSIPFADLLTFPSTWTRNRRDHPRFLNLIEVIAFLHQYQRPLRYLDTDQACERAPSDLTDEELAAVYVEASVEDYGAAKTLYAEILSETLAELKRPLRELLSVFEKLVAEKKARGHENAFLLVRELRDATRLEQRVIRRYLAELVELEHLTQTRGPNGSASAYRLTELESRPAAEIEGLLSVEELRRRIEERRRQP